MISYWRGRSGPCRERWSSYRQRKQEATLGAGKGPLLWTIGTVLVKKTALCVALQAGGHCWRVSCLLQRGHPGGEGAGEPRLPLTGAPNDLFLLRLLRDPGPRLVNHVPPLFPILLLWAQG